MRGFQEYIAKKIKGISTSIDRGARRIGNDGQRPAKNAIEGLNPTINYDEELRALALLGHAECVKFFISTSGPILHNMDALTEGASKATVQLADHPDMAQVKERLKTRAATSRKQINEALRHANPRKDK